MGRPKPSCGTAMFGRGSKAEGAITIGSLAAFYSYVLTMWAPVRRISKRELDEAFDRGWTIESIMPTRFEVIPEMKDAFSPGGPKAWFAVVLRKG